MDPLAFVRARLSRIDPIEVVEDVVQRLPFGGDPGAGYLAGDAADDAIDRVTELSLTNRLATVEFLAGAADDAVSAQRTRDEYLRLIGTLDTIGLSHYGATDITLSPPALGLGLAGGEDLAREHIAAIAAAAAGAGTTVTLGMEGHDTVEPTLVLAADLREEIPTLGVTVQACLRRTEGDCADLGRTQTRVRLVKGGVVEPDLDGYRKSDDVDLSYVRCLKALMAGSAYPLVATHDQRLIDIAQALAVHHRRGPDTYEFQMLLGVRESEQVRIADRGHLVRIYVPYGPEGSTYVAHRLAARARIADVRSWR